MALGLNKVAQGIIDVSHQLASAVDTYLVLRNGEAQSRDPPLAPTSHRPVKGCMLLGVPLSVKILNPTSIAPPERLYKHARLGYPKPMACLNARQHGPSVANP